MARPLRIEYPGAIYHVTSRGNRRSTIYRNDDDRVMFLEILESTVKRFGWVCHAYCLMGNHYHLLIETPQPNLSRGMRQLNGVYTQRYNYRHKKSGHVYQGRFKGVLIERNSHLLEVIRYVVLNPLRAKLVNHPQQWRWSSYRATAGTAKAPDWLTTDWTLSQFGRGRNKAQKEYRQFVREGLGESAPWDNLVGGLILGSESFVAQCRACLSDDLELSELSAEHRDLLRPTLDALFDCIDMTDKDSRNRVMVTAYREHAYTLKALAMHLGIHYSTVSRAIKAAEEKMWQ
jgi:putative transposase